MSGLQTQLLALCVIFAGHAIKPKRACNGVFGFGAEVGSSDGSSSEEDDDSLERSRSPIPRGICKDLSNDIKIPYADYSDEIDAYTGHDMVEQIKELGYNDKLAVVLTNLSDLSTTPKGENDKANRYPDKRPKWSEELKSNDLKVRSLPDDHDVSALGKGYTMAIVAAQLEMEEEKLSKLPDELRTGIFEKAKTYPALIRVSHTWVNGQQLIRYAIKVNLAENPNEAEKYEDVMDILLTETAHVFPMKDADQLDAFVKMTDRHTSALTKAGNLLPHFLDLMRMGWTMHMINQEGKTSDTSILAKDYYSMTTYELGGKAVMKYAFVSRLVDGPDAVPVGADGENFYDFKDPISTPSDSFKSALQLQMKDTLVRRGVEYDFKIKMATNKEVHAVNDASASWADDDKDAAWWDMGVLRIPPQNLDTNFINAIFAKALPSDKVLSFNPAHSPHKPVGDINLFRQYVYPRYDAQFQRDILGKPETQGLTDAFLDCAQADDDIQPITGAAPMRCPFMALQAALGQSGGGIGASSCPGRRGGATGASCPMSGASSSSTISTVVPTRVPTTVPTQSTLRF